MWNAYAIHISRKYTIYKTRMHNLNFWLLTKYVSFYKNRYQKSSLKQSMICCDDQRNIMKDTWSKIYWVKGKTTNNETMHRKQYIRNEIIGSVKGILICFYIYLLLIYNVIFNHPTDFPILIPHIHFLILVLLKENKSLQCLNEYKNLCIERRLVDLSTSPKVLRQIIPLHLHMYALRDS